MFICFFTFVVSVILTNLYHYCYYYLVIIVVIIAVIIINYLPADLCTSSCVHRSAAPIFMYTFVLRTGDFSGARNLLVSHLGCPFKSKKFLWCSQTGAVAV